MAARGKLSKAWGLYVGDIDVARARRRVTLIPAEGRVNRDGMADYIEDATWWIARSSKSINQIFRDFDRGNVACILYEQTGAVIPLGRRNGQHLIAIQLVQTGRDWDLDLCLAEAGIIIEEIWNGEDIEVDND